MKQQHKPEPDDSAAGKAQAHVSQKQILDALEALARFGGREDGGVARETLTQVDIDARRHLIAQARALGCEVETDDCANLFFRRPGTTSLPPVLTGSHADTQPVGGKLDGAYGVIAGLELIAALNDAGLETLRPIEVVAWTNEEGSRFGPGAMGSSAFVEPARLAAYRAAVDSDNITFGAALDAALAATPDVTRRPLQQPISACLELHIEQGPVLERAGTSLGVVTGIQSVRWYRVECVGSAAHAGTTPMEDRSDAMAAANGIAHQLYAYAAAQSGSQLRLTLGRWQVSPNSVNTIPGKVEFSVDVRCLDATVLERFEQFLHQATGAYPWRGSVDVACFFARAPTFFPDAMVSVVERACTTVCRLSGQAPPLRLTSGAFHDAMYLADHCPTGMIFVPSKGGISHNAAEETAPDELFLGVQALARAVVELANQ
jgi:N-carbamoyl-L-amino-acid hydrolase